ncbi:MAG: hypothetical protein JWR61_1509 [Ferruginibacter sp.]|nr:hypothetical protein [Ferruginibacter sp.]
MTSIDDSISERDLKYSATPAIAFSQMVAVFKKQHGRSLHFVNGFA